MNLYEYSSKNREMGILLDRNIDKDLFEKAVQEAESIINNAEKKSFGLFGNIVGHFVSGKVSENIPSNKPRITHHLNENKGYCIRCGTNITLDSSKPYCSQCYNTWSQFSNPNYSENHCL